MLKTIEGIYRDGAVELLEKPLVPNPARVLVTFLAETLPSREAARTRMLARMRRGMNLGGPPYPSRSEIYDREGQE